MNNLKARTMNNKVTFYTDENGNVPEINSISFQDIPDTVFTIVKKEGVPYVHLPQKNMTLVKLEDAINKYNLIIFKVS